MKINDQTHVVKSVQHSKLKIDAPMVSYSFCFLNLSA